MTSVPVPTATPKIVLVEDHSLFAESLEMALGMEGYDARRVVLDPEQASQTRLLNTILRLKPRLVLLDLDLGAYGRGVEMIHPMVAEGIVVVIVTSELDRARWGECIAEGARNVIPKDAPLSEILDAIRKLSNGREMLSRQERMDLVAQWHRHQEVEREIRSRLDHLTKREAEVLGLLMKGKQVGDIAKERFVSESTVRTQVKSVLAKLQVSSQLTAVGLAHKANWSPPSSRQKGGRGQSGSDSARPRVVGRASRSR